MLKLMASLRVLIAGLVVLTPLTARLEAGIILAGWEFSGVTDYGPSPFAASQQSTSFTPVNLRRGSGISTTGTGAAGSWGGNGMIATNLANAISDSDFITISFTVTGSNSVSFESIDAYNVRRSNAGPTTGQWQYQVNGAGWTNLGSEITWGTTVTAGGNAQSAISLTSIVALQGVNTGSTVDFRVVNWGGSAGNGTWYLNNLPTAGAIDFSVSGTVTAVPEPTSFLLLASVGAAALGIKRVAARKKKVARSDSKNNLQSLANRI